jgi:hypothetical protein
MADNMPWWMPATEQQVWQPGTPAPTLPPAAATTPQAFDAAHLQQVVDSVDETVKQVAAVAQQFYAEARPWLGYINGLQQWLDGASALLGNLLQQFEKSIAAAPVALQAYQARYNWQKVIDLTTNVPHKLTPLELHVNQDWRPGTALTDYLAIVKLHADAAQRVGSVSAAAIADRLARVAGYGLNYYVSLSGLATKMFSVFGGLVRVLVAAAPPSPALANEVMTLLERFLDMVKEGLTNYMTLYSSLLIWCRPVLETDAVDHTALPDDGWPKPYLNLLNPGRAR